MTRNDDNHSDDEDKLLPGYDANAIGKLPRREPRFGGFDEEEDEYEEPDRDTDYTSGYRADNEEEEFEDSFTDEEDRVRRVYAPAYQPSSIEGWHSRSSFGSEPDPSVAEEPDAWLDKEDDLQEQDEEWDDESDRENYEQNHGSKWPWSLIATAIVAFVLLTAGGYGVIQQRAATQEELRQLRATLATNVNTADENDSREALQALQQSYDKLAANAEALTLENRRLTDTVTGLEAQLGVQQAVLTKTVPAANAVKPQAADPVASLYGNKPLPSANQIKPAATPEASSPQQVAPKPVAPKPATAPTVAAASSGPWFVNFGSYSSRNMAETWASKLHPGAGKVIIAPIPKDGQTLYRVRVVGLASRGSAQEVARKLEAELRVSALWVGEE